MKKCQRIKLSDIFDLDGIDLNGGIFTYFSLEDGGGNPYYPLVHDFIYDDNGFFLDSDYHIGYSADKYISPLFEKIFIKTLDEYGYTIEDFYNGDWKNDYIQIIDHMFKYNDGFDICNIIYQHFGWKWKKIWDALVTATYNPIHNYDMEEKRTPNLTHTETFNSVTDTRTPNLTTSGSAETKTGVFGFNGGSAKDSSTNDGESTQSVTGTDTNVKTGNISNTDTGTDTITRKGNIGVTTSQQLIESELELRKHDFYKIVYNDIDSILCMKIY